jgi:dihydroxyacetone kinase-like predicted kinase
MTGWETVSEEKEADAEAPTLAELVALGEKLAGFNDKIAEHESEAKRFKALAKKISEGELREAMESAECAGFTLKDGRSITLKDDIFVTTSGKYRQIVCDWLREVERDGAVRRMVSIEFGKGNHAEADKLADKLGEDGYRAQAADNIHAGTFKSIVKEMLAEGIEIPLDDLGAYQRSTATLK